MLASANTPLAILFGNLHLSRERYTHLIPLGIHLVRGLIAIESVFERHKFAMLHTFDLSFPDYDLDWVLEVDPSG